MFARIRNKLHEAKERRDRTKKERAPDRADRSAPDPRQDLSAGSRGGPNITGGAGGVM